LIWGGRFFVVSRFVPIYSGTQNGSGTEGEKHHTVSRCLFSRGSPQILPEQKRLDFGVCPRGRKFLKQRNAFHFAVQFIRKRQDIGRKQHPKRFLAGLVHTVFACHGVYADRRYRKFQRTGLFRKFTPGGFLDRFSQFPVSAGNLIGISSFMLAKHPFSVVSGYDHGKFQQPIFRCFIETDLQVNHPISMIKSGTARKCCPGKVILRYFASTTSRGTQPIRPDAFFT